MKKGALSKDTLLVSGGVSLIGSAVAAISALVITVIVGRGYGPSGTGLFFLATGWFAVATGILKLGTNSGLVRALSRRDALNQDTSRTRIIGYAVVPVAIIAVALSIVVALAAPTLAGWLASPGVEDQLTTILRVLAPFIAIAAVMSVGHTAVRMERGVLAFTVVQNVMVPLGRLTTLLIAVLLGWDIVSAVAAWAALLPLWLLLTTGLLVSPLREDLRRRRTHPAAGETFSTFWRFTGGRALGAAVEVCLEWADVLVIAATRPVAEAGVYAVVTRAARAGQIADRSLRVAVSPRIAQLLALERYEAAAQLHTGATQALVLLAWPFYISLIAVGPAVLALFGGDFVEGYSYLVIVAAASLVATMGGMLQSVMLMAGRSSWQVYEKSAVLLISVTANIILVPRFGLWAAAGTFACVVVIDTFVAALIVQRGVGVELRPSRVLPATVLPVLTFGGVGATLTALFGADPWILIPHAVLSTTLYALALYGFRRRWKSLRDLLASESSVPDHL